MVSHGHAYLVEASCSVANATQQQQHKMKDGRDRRPRKSGEEEEKAGRGGGWEGQEGWARSERSQEGEDRGKISTLAVNRFLRVPAMPSTTAV